MAQHVSTTSGPLIGLVPLFYNLAESGRAVLIAKRLVDHGGQVIFFSHGGRYEYLAKEAGFDIVRCNPLYTDALVKQIIQINRGERKGIAYTESFIRESVKAEVTAFQNTGVKLVVAFVNYPCAISTRAAGIPYINVSPAPGRFYLRVPDQLETSWSRRIPQKIKIPVVNWWFFHSKKLVHPFNIVAQEYGLPKFRSTIEVVDGDATLATNFLEFINIFPKQQMYPQKNYIGIISLEELFAKKDADTTTPGLPTDIHTHLSTDKRSILLAMGSSGDKTLFIRLLTILNTLPYQVVAITANILKQDELPDIGPHIMIKNFVPSIHQLHKAVDISVIHGGQGTVYAAAYAGKPIIGFPMQFEQHLNLEKMVGHGVGKMLSRHYFTDHEFKASIEHIFTNYPQYYHQAQKLMNTLPPPQGDVKAAKRLFELITEFKIKT